MNVKQFIVLLVVLCVLTVGAFHFVSIPHVQMRAPGMASGTSTGTYTVKSVSILNTPMGDATTRTALDNIDQYVDAPQGTVSWHVFGATKEITVEGKTSDGYDFQYYRPGFTPDVKALDGKEITVKGFMFPLGEDSKQSLFLFGPFPLNCPFHYHVGPSLVFEVHADKRPIKFSYDPVMLKGRLQLVNEDKDNSTFYRLLDAEQIRQ